MIFKIALLSMPVLVYKIAKILYNNVNLSWLITFKTYFVIKTLKGVTTLCLTIKVYNFQTSSSNIYLNINILVTHNL
jgi:hypothetical protein